MHRRVDLYWAGFSAFVYSAGAVAVVLATPSGHARAAVSPVQQSELRYLGESTCSRVEGNSINTASNILDIIYAHPANVGGCECVCRAAAGFHGKNCCCCCCCCLLLLLLLRAAAAAAAAAAAVAVAVAAVAAAALLLLPPPPLLLLRYLWELMMTKLVHESTIGHWLAASHEMWKQCWFYRSLGATLGWLSANVCRI